MTNLLEFYSTRYEKVIMIGNFNILAENKVMKDFLQEHTLYNMMKQNTGFNGDGGLCIDLLFTNSKFLLASNKENYCLERSFELIINIFE